VRTAFKLNLSRKRASGFHSILRIRWGTVSRIRTSTAGTSARGSELDACAVEATEAMPKLSRAPKKIGHRNMAALTSTFCANAQRMRTRLSLLVFFSAFLPSPQPAWAAGDGGDAGTDDGGSSADTGSNDDSGPVTDAGVGCDEAGADEAGVCCSADGSACGPQCDSLGADDAGVCCSAGGFCPDKIPVIACDGDLCDTVQGRPTCAVTPSTFEQWDPGWKTAFASVSLAAGLALVARRKARRS
jgi:hypothetical protein